MTHSFDSSAHPIPRAGLFSRMILTASAGVVCLVLPLLSNRVHDAFSKPLSTPVLIWLSVTAVLMAFHKLESYWMGEFDQCPVYLGVGKSSGDRCAACGQDSTFNPRREVFLTFVPTFLGMTLLLILALWGPPWPYAIIGIWIAQGLHELHHMAKSIIRKRLYPGTLTSPLFSASVLVGLFPVWWRDVMGVNQELPSLVGILVGIVGLVVLLVFMWEDRGWTKAASPAVWRSSSGPMPQSKGKAGTA